MKRYRVINVDFDARANFLRLKIEDSWDEAAKASYRLSKENIRQGLLREYGIENAQEKLQNFLDINASPFSILAFHNKFFRQARNAFVVESYFPALTSACALGERILNHLLVALRDFYKGTPEYKTVYKKESFDDLDTSINTLIAWDVLQPEAVAAFKELRDIRHKAIHFRPETDQHDRSLALTAILTLARIIDGQFSAFGTHPWFIENTPGTSFLKKSMEDRPFIQKIYIPNCALVGPYHKLTIHGGMWSVNDDFQYEDKDISDEEFANLYNDKAAHPKAT
jgi:hypothetical protein